MSKIGLVTNLIGLKRQGKFSLPLHNSMALDNLKDMLARWPAAVDKDLICDPTNEDHKVERGNSIVSFFVTENLNGKKFLDFGCGEGHTVKAAKDRGASLAVGYDVSKQGNFSWDASDSNLFTNWDAIKDSGPYDVVVLYDVIDHTADPSAMLSQVRSVTNSNSTIYLLAHPWCGRHGGHLYHDFNYAFAHIIFTDTELRDLGAWKDYKVQKIANPINRYKELLTTNFFIAKSDIIKDPVEDFFRQPILQNRIIARVNAVNPNLTTFPRFQMEQSFHEYVLKTK